MLVADPGLAKIGKGDSQQPTPPLLICDPDGGTLHEDVEILRPPYNAHVDRPWSAKRSELSRTASKGVSIVLRPRLPN